MALYQGAIYTFQYARSGAQSVGGTPVTPTDAHGAFVDFVLTTGLLTDELHSGDLGGSSAAYLTIGANATDSLDARQLVEDATVLYVYNELQNVRGTVSQAIGALNTYAPDSSPTFRGRLYAFRGYAEVMLADLFCSGVPLSTLDYGGDFTYRPGSTTAQVYEHAIAQFDTAIALSADSARILNLARVGRARALLNLQRYAEAAQAVADVPDNFQYQFPVDWKGGLAGVQSIFSAFGANHIGPGVTVADREGENGLPFISDDDPRSAVEAGPHSPNPYGMVQYLPMKYGGAARPVAPITVASGIEARLIEAEAALQASDSVTWLAKLNRARTLAASTLPALTDPGSDSARVSLLFRERAFDLFLTGNRQGDLRRMVRQYGRTETQVYPTGAFPGPLPVYGPAVTAPIPTTERLNPLFAGCLDRSA
jgi:hypothetical protein